MATFDISEKVSFTYSYHERDGQQVTSGEFFRGSGSEHLGVRIEVARDDRYQAIDDITRYARTIGEILDGEIP